MNRLHFDQEFKAAEIERAKERELCRDRLFVLLLGPSAVGKSTIIKQLNAHSDTHNFSYVKPIMTRPNREGETDKISVPDEEFDDLERSGQFVVVNDLYGVRYGTPLEGILSPLQKGDIPILDYPLATVDKLKRPEYDTLKYYVYPQSIEDWYSRVKGSGRDISNRLELGQRELGFMANCGFSHNNVDISVVNPNNTAEVAVREILTSIDLVTI
jgi:guanylate kinase